jgi:diguanylate cyclase (GGDEF)-like protein/PAS domain S-box-containing protein
MSITDDSLFHKYILDNLYDGVYAVTPERKIIYWNNGAERISGYNCSEVIGKRCMDNILIHVDGQGLNLCQTQCPLSQAMTDGKLREHEVFLHHKDGHRVPVLLRVLPLRGRDDEIVGGVEIFSDNTSRMMLRHKIDELERSNMLDKLTNVSSREHLEMQIASELSRMRRYGWPFAILFIDIDNFKHVNDTYGHEMGDKVLKMVASTMSSSSRHSDVVGRWGGEEFIAILVNVTPEQIHDIAERYRILVEQSRLFTESTIVQVTVSIGSTTALPTDTIGDLIGRADKMMYESKLAGRNRVTVDQGITAQQTPT